MDAESARTTLELSKTGERDTRSSKQQTASTTNNSKMRTRRSMDRHGRGDIRPLFLALKKEREESQRKHQDRHTSATNGHEKRDSNLQSYRQTINHSTKQQQTTRKQHNTNTKCR